ncbi:hypothetical protein BgiMline_008927 [Biomphalaria glabrata]|nr:alginate lyase [Biomphalaria glabrata]
MRSGVFINIIQAIDDGSPSCLSYLKLLKNLKVFDGDAVVSKLILKSSAWVGTQEMLFILILALTVTSGLAGDLSQTLCEHVPTIDLGLWVAKVHSTEPLVITKISSQHGGDIVLSRDDGKYFEIQGSAEYNVTTLCLTVQGVYRGDVKPSVTMEVNILPQSEARTKRATEVWSLASVPQTTDIKTLMHGFEPYHHLWGQGELSATTKHSSSPALTVHYPKGSYAVTPQRGAGFMTTPTNLPDGVTSLIMKYDVYFENFGFGWGGKLPGLYGGDKTEGAFKCSGGNNPGTCFSLRLMWRENGDGEVYAYIPREHQASDFEHRPDIEINYSYGHSLMRGAIRFRSGSWQTVTEEVHLNTPQQANGRVKFCLKHGSEAEVCKEATRLNFRNHADYFLRGMMFSTFFGGSSSTHFAAPNDCHTYFRNFALIIPSSTVVG